MLRQTMIIVLFVKCLSTPEVCLCVFPFHWVHWAAGFNFPGMWVQFSIHCILSHMLVEQSLQNLVPAKNWGIICYLRWLELMFSCAAFDMRYVRLCSTLSPVLEAKMTYGGVCLHWRWTECWGSCHTNFPTSISPKINIRFVC